MRTKSHSRAVVVIIGLGATALSPLTVPPGAAQAAPLAVSLATLGAALPAAAAATVGFSLGGPVATGGSSAASGVDFGPQAVGLDFGVLLTITNTSTQPLSFPAIPVPPNEVLSYPTTTTGVLSAVAITASSNGPSCNGAKLGLNQFCDIELSVLPLQAGKSSATVQFGGDGNQTSFTFAVEGNEGYILATSGAAAVYFDTFGASTGSHLEPAFVDQKERPLNAPIVGDTATQTGDGYLLVASDGGIFSFGDASFLGSEGGQHLNQPIVGLAGHQAASFTSGGGTDGYWEVASDGGIFTFGQAGYYGSTGSMHLNQPIVGMATTPDGNGYWLVAADGGIFAFGDARYAGSTGSMHLNQPIVGMAATPDGNGYWLVAADGGIFAFGDARYAGSTGNIALTKPIVGMATTPDGGGYWLAAADAGSFSEGNAPYIQGGFLAPDANTVAIGAFGDSVIPGEFAASRRASTQTVATWHGAGVHTRS